MEQVNFYPYKGDYMGLGCDENYLVFRWKGPGKILFSVSQVGYAVTCHLASDKKGLRHLRKAAAQFVDFVAFLFDWCKMVFAQVELKSVERMVKKIGFCYLAENEHGRIYVRIL